MYRAYVVDTDLERGTTARKVLENIVVMMTDGVEDVYGAWGTDDSLFPLMIASTGDVGDETLASLSDAVTTGVLTHLTLSPCSDDTAARVILNYLADLDD